MLPAHPFAQIHMVLPPLLEIRNIVTRMSHLADDVEMSASHVSHV